MATAKRKTDTPMNDRLPGAMTEAMVKGALVTESDMDHGEVAALLWGQAVTALVKVRGGNYTYNDVYETEAEDVRVVGATLDPNGMGTIELDDAEDTFDDLADLDDLDMDVPTPEEAGQALFIGMPTTKDYIFDGHAGAGPSGAERWMTCTASLGASRSFLETLTANQQAEQAKAGTAARQGTTAHAAAESEARLMLGEITEDQHDNNILDLTLTPLVDDEAYDDEMGEWIEEYGDLIKQYHQNGHAIHIEMRVTAAVELMTVDSDGNPNVHEIKGSADAVAEPTKADPVLSVVDLKYGKGKEVTAEENPQAKIYALGVLGELAERGLDIFDPKVIERIDLIIVQPRLGGIKVWSTTVDELLDWRDDVLSPALTEALGGLKAGAQFVPGELQCQWCPARGGCAALAEARMDAATELFEVIVDSEFNGEEFPETTTLSDERLGQLYTQIEGLTKIKDDLKAEVQRRLHRGGSVPGYQLVNYTPRSQWKEGAVDELHPDTYDQDRLDAAVIDKLWKRDLLSPTQALKMVGGKGNEGIANVLETLIDRPDKRPIVAPEGDRRKTWEGKPPEAMFEDESEEA